MTDNAERPYDLFISFAGADRPWVEGYLLDALNQVGAKVISEAAFTLGAPRVTEFERAIQQSKRTLLVLTQAYLSESFNQFVNVLVQSYGLESGTWPVIPLILEQVELPPRLAFLVSLDATDPTTWSEAVARLCATLQTAPPAPSPSPECPYPGMRAFREQDHAHFFGRDQEIEDLVRKLRSHPFAAVIGASGSGKSSLVFAGLLPALRKTTAFGPGEWLFHTMRPGDQPLAELERIFHSDKIDALDLTALLAVAPNAARLLLVVDQFEELFTLGAGQAKVFIAELTALTKKPNAHVVITVRTDFYGELITSDLWSEIRSHRLEIAPLDELGLRAAIVKPAEDVGVFIESALVERLVTGSLDQPGVLPFVQEILVRLWAKLERRFLPLRAYEALVMPYSKYSGSERTGLQVALAQLADEIIAKLDQTQQAVARRIFLRLVQFGEGRPDTRRQQAVDTLRASTDDRSQFDATVRYLAENRLLTLSGEQSGQPKVDISHEAMLTGWPTLHDWISQRRSSEQTRRRLEDKAAEWQRLTDQGGGLLDEVELREAERWLESEDAAALGSQSDTLTRLIGASRAAITARQQADKEAQERELRQAQELAEEQRQRAEEQTRYVGQLRQRAVLLAGLLVLALIAATWAVIASQQSRRAQQAAEVAAASEAVARQQAEDLAKSEKIAHDEADAARVQAEGAKAAESVARQQAEAQLALARSRQVAAVARNRLDDGDAEGALLLSAAALTLVTDTVEAESVLRAASDQWRGVAEIGGHLELVSNVRFSPGGDLLAISSRDDTVHLWKWNGAGVVGAPLVLQHGGDVTGLVYNHEGTRLATSSRDNTARIWDTATGAELQVLPHKQTLAALGFPTDDLDGVRAIMLLPDNRTVITRIKRYILFWDLQSGDLARPQPLLHNSDVRSFALNRDGSLLLAGTQDRIARLWHLPTGASLDLSGYDNAVTTAQFSRDGRYMVSASERLLRVDIVTRLPITAGGEFSFTNVLRIQDGSVFAGIAFSPDSKRLAVAAADGTVRIWTLEKPGDSPAVLRGHTQAVTGLTFSSDGRLLATTSLDQTARLWRLDTNQTEVILRQRAFAFAPTFSPDNRLFLTVEDRLVRIWNAQSGADYGAYFTNLRPATALAVSGDAVLSAGEFGRIEAWNPISGTGRAYVSGLDRLSAIAVSPDQAMIAVGDNQGRIAVVDATRGVTVTAWMAHVNGVRSLLFTPDGASLISSGGEPTIRVWQWRTGAQTRELAGHSNDVNALALDANGALFSASSDGTVHRWDWASGVSRQLFSTQFPLLAIAVSADGQHVAAGGYQSRIQVWRVDATAAPLLLRHNEGAIIRTLAFANDGRLISGDDQGIVRLWTSDFHAAVELNAHSPRQVNAVRMSQDGRIFYTAGGDSLVYAWPVSTADALALGCRHTAAKVSDDDWRDMLNFVQPTDVCATTAAANLPTVLSAASEAPAPAVGSVPIIHYFESVSGSVVAQGDAVTLRWSLDDADRVDLEINGESDGTVGTNETSYKLSQDTDYTLVVTRGGVQQRWTLHVNARR